MKHFCLSPSVKLSKRNLIWRRFILFHVSEWKNLSNWRKKNESTFRIRRKIIRILGEKFCQIDVGETRFVFPVQEKRHSKFGFEAKLFVFWVKKICQIDVSETQCAVARKTTFRIDWRLQEFPLDLELEKLHTSRAVQVRATSD